MMSATRRLCAAIILSSLFFVSKAQSPGEPVPDEVKKSDKPYKVSTSGKQVTIKSTKNIEHVMLWTSSGHRVIEQKEINAGSYTFTIPVNEKVFFLMVGLVNGKIYTEKIGVQ
jgi:hypothetical protein